MGKRKLGGHMKTGPCVPKPTKRKKEPDNPHTTNRITKNAIKINIPKAHIIHKKASRNTVSSTEGGAPTRPPTPSPTVKNHKLNLRVDWNTATEQGVIVTSNIAPGDVASVGMPTTSQLSTPLPYHCL